jgi:hypothetical protein
MLKSLLRKLAGFKQKVQQGSKYDKLNLADDVKARSPLVKSVVDRNARIFIKQVLGEDITVLPEDYDTNQSASLAVQEFVLTSVEKNPAANLILVEIVAGAAESIWVSKSKKISITTDDGVSDHDSIKALIEANSKASALITVEINAGEGATLVDASELASLSGAIG